MAEAHERHGSIANSLGGLLHRVVPHRPPPTVRSFEEDARHYGPLNRRPLGIRAVPLDRIVGSVGRARELGPDFQPLRRRTRVSPRYDRIAKALARGEILPPVELYKLGYDYYVLDGNHRVAAMKELTDNDGEIDAHVTQFLPLGDTEAARVFLERRAFEEATGLTQVGAVERGHYGQLRAEIEAHQAARSAEGRELSLKDAASDWFANVWLPRAEAIRAAGLRRHWPEKRTADIYCYIAEHRVEEEQRRGRPVAWPEALESFRARHLSQRERRRRRPRLWRLLRQARPVRSWRMPPSLPRPDDSLDPEAQPTQ
jgi:hypothetical protein